MRNAISVAELSSVIRKRKTNVYISTKMALIIASSKFIKSELDNIEDERECRKSKIKRLLPLRKNKHVLIFSTVTTQIGFRNFKCYLSEVLVDKITSHY